MAISGNLYVWDKGVGYAPDGAGVYALYNEDKKLIYIGGSINLRETLTNYFEIRFAKDLYKRETKYYKREVTLNWKERAEELLNEYKEKQPLPKKAVPYEIRFVFYETLGKPLAEEAKSLEEFWEKIQRVPVSSLEFHHKRGDFSRWIRDVFKEIKMAEDVESVDRGGERLREELLNALIGTETQKCPRCGVQTRQRKTWKMAGNPSKNGEQIQLTIGLYTCYNCNKTFRKCVKKERVKLESEKGRLGING